MKALVTGASGFVGHHLLAHLEAEGDAVIGTDRSAGGPDLADATGLETLFRDVAPDVVYHLAGQSDVAGSWSRPTETFEANVGGTLNVLTACRAAGVERVVAVTSADIYGRVSPAELPLDESAEIRPVSPYAASKAAADIICHQAFLGYDQAVIRARSFNHFGPGQNENFVASALAARIARAEFAGADEITVGDTSARRDFTDVRDVVRAYRLLAVSGRPGEAYNVCTGVDVSVAEIAHTLLSLATRPLKLVTDPERLRPADIPVLRGDPAKLIADTRWAPQHTLTDTLGALLDYWRTEQTGPAQENPIP